MVSCAMPFAPVVTRSPASTGVPRAGVERWPLALVRLTSPVTKVNSPLAALAHRGVAASAASSMRFTELRAGAFMACLRLDHFAADRRRDLVAVEVVDVDVGAVVRVRVREAQRALVAELPAEAEGEFSVDVLAVGDDRGARELVLVLAVDHAQPVEDLQLRRDRVLQVAAQAAEVLA